MIKDIIRLDYQELKQSKPVAARQVILQALKEQQGIVSKTVRVMNVNPAAVYKALKKPERAGISTIVPERPKECITRPLRRFKAKSEGSRSNGLWSCVDKSRA